MRSLELVCLWLLRVQLGTTLGDGEKGSTCSEVGGHVDVLSGEVRYKFSSEQSEVVAADCSIRAQWPLKRTCSTVNSGIYYDPSSRSLKSVISSFHDVQYVHSTWNISSRSSFSPMCAVHIPRAIFMPIAYDENAYQTEGSNYYVSHVDALIPLWNALRKYGADETFPEIFLFAFDINGNVDLSSRAFEDKSKYWIQTLQILLGNVPLQVGTLQGMEQFMHRAVTMKTDSNIWSDNHWNSGSLCFEDIKMGVPSYSPTRRSLQKFARTYRQAALRPSVYAFPKALHTTNDFLDSETVKLCASMTKKIGIVNRKGRRKIANLNEFLNELGNIGTEWCQRFNHTENNCDITFENVFFGNENVERHHTNKISSVEKDILQIQEFAVLLGIQGSGLINALYMPPVSTAVAVYLNDGWPISSADPLSYLGDRGPYIVHINKNSSNVVCNYDKDEHCDSGDMIMQAEEFRPVIIEALEKHLKACQ